MVSLLVVGLDEIAKRLSIVEKKIMAVTLEEGECHKRLRLLLLFRNRLLNMQKVLRATKNPNRRRGA